MPAVSKKQFRFMEAVKRGDIKKKGLSPQKASEFVDGVGYKSLPKKKKSPKQAALERIRG